MGISLEDTDWPGQLVYVISKGTRIRQPVPASLSAFRYLAADGLADRGSPWGAPATGIRDRSRTGRCGALSGGSTASSART
jgi:hypothetical protein